MRKSLIDYQQTEKVDELDPYVVPHGLANEGSTGWRVRTGEYVQKITLVAPPERFELYYGGSLSHVVVAYETYGELAPTRDNAILVAHALTGDSHVARHGENDLEPGWWEGMVGPGAPLDTNKYFVVCSNVLGGCQGTTGPSSINPVTGEPYGPDFPLISIKDMVRVQHRLLQALGVERLVTVIGGSMGGMQAIQWAVEFPTMVQSVIPIATPGRASAQSIAYNDVMRQVIMLDPGWRGGRYYNTLGPRTGLSIARMLGMITYRSNQEFDERFGRQMIGVPADMESPTFGRLDSCRPLAQGGAAKTGASLSVFDISFEVERYLHHQGEKLVLRFDANTYLYLMKAMDLFDLAEGFGSYCEALSRIRCKVLVIGIDSDILYPNYQQVELVEALRKTGVDAAYAQVHAPWGHDSFLIEVEKVGKIVREFLDSLSC